MSAAITLPDSQRTGVGPFLTLLTGDMNVRRPGRVWLRMDSTTPGTRVLERRRRVRTKVVVSLLPPERRLKVLMRSAKLCYEGVGLQSSIGAGLQDLPRARSVAACCRRSCGR